MNIIAVAGRVNQQLQIFPDKEIYCCHYRNVLSAEQNFHSIKNKHRMSMISDRINYF